MIRDLLQGLQAAGQYKLQVSILGVLTFIAGFMVWRYQQEQTEKYAAEQQQVCAAEKERAYYAFRNTALFTQLQDGYGENTAARAGIDAPLLTGEEYLYNSYPKPVLPKSPRYPGEYFRQLSSPLGGKTGIYLLARVKEHQGDRALITTSCSPQAFWVSLSDLYVVPELTTETEAIIRSMGVDPSEFENRLNSR